MNTTMEPAATQNPNHLLDRQQEVELCQRIEAGLYAQWLLGRGGHAHPIAELQRLAESGRAAWTTLWLANVGLVKLLAWRYARRNPDLMDELMQQGHVALADALMRYDHRRGARISTHAWLWIKGELSSVLTEQRGYGRRMVPEDFSLEYHHPPAPDPFEAEPDVVDVWPLVARLPRQERQLLVLLANGWTQHRAAARLGMSQTSVRRVRDRAVNQVRIGLGLPPLESGQTGTVEALATVTGRHPDRGWGIGSSRAA